MGRIRPINRRPAENASASELATFVMERNTHHRKFRETNISTAMRPSLCPTNAQIDEKIENADKKNDTKTIVEETSPPACRIAFTVANSGNTPAPKMSRIVSTYMPIGFWMAFIRPFRRVNVPREFPVVRNTHFGFPVKHHVRGSRFLADSPMRPLQTNKTADGQPMVSTCIRDEIGMR